MKLLKIRKAFTKEYISCRILEDHEIIQSSDYFSFLNGEGALLADIPPWYDHSVSCVMEKYPHFKGIYIFTRPVPEYEDIEQENSYEITT